MKNKLFKITGVLAALLITATAVSGAAVQGTTSAALFDNAVPINQALYDQYPSLLLGEGTNHLQWGLPFPYNANGPRSELLFTTNAFDADIGDVFSLGTLTHVNTTIFVVPYETRLSSADLMFSLALNNPAGFAGTDLTIDLGITNTPNTVSAGGSDLITFGDIFPFYEFTSAGMTYILQILGFGDVAQGESSIAPQLAVPEGSSGSVDLLGRLVASPNDPQDEPGPGPEPEPIPAPASLVLLCVGIAGWLGLSKNKKAL